MTRSTCSAGSGASSSAGGGVLPTTTRKRSASTHGPPLRLMALLAALLALALVSLTLQMQGSFSARRGLARRLERFGKPYVLARNQEYVDVLDGKAQDGDFQAAEEDAEASAADSEHLNRLRDVCLTHGRSHVVPWTFGRDGEGDTDSLVGQSDGGRLLETLRECPGVDLFYADRDMGLGYCEDYAVYAKYLRARILPSWVLGATFVDPRTRQQLTYHDLCPATPVLFFNHYWDDYPFSFAFAWPATKPVFLMPNIEMFELAAAHYWSVDLVLCKTAMCYERVTKWYRQEGNPRGTAVVYTRHTSADYAAVVRSRSEGGEDIAIDRKNYSDPVRFLHTSGKSLHKGTPQVLECWLTRPDLPTLDIYVHEQFFRERLAPKYLPYIKDSLNVNVHVGELPPDAFARLVAGSAFFLCPSIQEGYGHYMNQARAANGLIVTTDAPPMNELVTEETGVLIPTRTRSHLNQLLGGEHQGPHGLRGVEGMVALLSRQGVCDAVDAVIKQMTPAERERKARNARVAYLRDQRVFADKMKAIRALVRKHTREVVGR